MKRGRIEDISAHYFCGTPFSLFATFFYDVFGGNAKKHT